MVSATERRLSALEQVAAERRQQAEHLAPGAWFRWASTGELPPGEAGRAAVATWQRRRQEAAAVLAVFTDAEPAGE